MKSFFQIAVLLIVSSVYGMAATLNVPAQYSTVQAAVTAAQPGDTVLIAPGTYDETVTTVRNGTALAKITIDGQNKDTCIITKLAIGNSYHVIKNIKFTAPVYGQLNNIIYFKKQGHFNLLQDCIIDANFQLKVNGIAWEPDMVVQTNEASDNILERITVAHVRGYTMLAMAGMRNICRNSLFTDGVNIDFIRMFGTDNLIQNNVFQNNTEEDGLGWHPDWVQTFGNNGGASEGHIFEGNIVKNNSAAQLFQLSATGDENFRNWTFRNNIFYNSGLGGGGSMSGMKWYNNVFYKVLSGIGMGWRAFGDASLPETHPLDPLLSAPTPSGSLVAEGDNGQFQYGGWYQVTATSIPQSGPIEEGRTYELSIKGGDTVIYNGVSYTTGTTITGVAGVTTWSKIGTNETTYVFAKGTFTYNGKSYTRGNIFRCDPAVRTYDSSWPEQFNAWRVVVDIADNTEFIGNVFLDCGDPTRNDPAFYSVDQLAIGAIADYNYVGRNGYQPATIRVPSTPLGDPSGWAGSGWYEVHGINGGNPLFVDESNYDFRLRSNSPLIDKGTTIAGVTKDFAGTIRPLGTAPDIGAYEYDDGSPPPDPPPAGSPPTAPSALVANNITTTSVLLGWTDNANNENAFELERSTNNLSWTRIATLSSNTVSTTATGLGPSTTYYFRIRATNIDGNSAYSNTLTVVTLATPPPTPTDPPAAPSAFATIAIGAHSVATTWTDNSNNETGFEISRSLDGISWQTIYTAPGDVTSWTNSGLSAATTFYYRIRSINAGGSSVWSAVSSTTTAQTPPPRALRPKLSPVEVQGF
jgi:Fibronectin type III domain